MEAQLKRLVTIDEFELFVNLPENSERKFELITGDIYEVPLWIYPSAIAAQVVFRLHLYVNQNDTGHVLGAGCGYVINGQVYAPDAAFISHERLPKLTTSTFCPVPPELAVEVIADPNNRREQEALRRKIACYLSVGTVVWIVDPDARIVEVYQVGTPVQIYNEAGTIDGGDVLPGFKLPVKDIFLPNKVEKEA